VNDLPEILETTEAERQATGYVFTEGPLWHPDDFWYFNDINPGALYRLKLGGKAELVRKTDGGNGLTFDLEGRLIHCEGEGYRVTRTEHDGRITTLAGSYQGGRLNRPNDVVCHSDGSIWFTDPSGRRPFSERQIPSPKGINGVWAGASVYRVATDGSIASVADFEYPNGLAFSPDERTLYVANTRMSKYIHAIDVDASGKMLRRRIFADLNEGNEPGAPDGIKVDSKGRVFCTGPGGIWVTNPDGNHVGIIRLPEQAVNFTFGGHDLKTLFVAALTSVYTIRVRTPGLPHPWYRVRKGKT
jgi:gluconolactonase